MSLLSSATTASRIWLVDQNPLQLAEPPVWWQTMVYDFDKMLRVMPSQRDRVYRLCRVVRAEARLGLNALIVHDHPDTRACIKFGVIPVFALPLWAIRSDKIIRDLRASDSWGIFGGNPDKIVDAIEKGEAERAQKEAATADEQLDELSTNAFRAVKFGRPEQVVIGMARTDPALRTPFRDLPPLPSLQNRNRVSSAVPPEGTVASTPKIVLTDL